LPFAFFAFELVVSVAGVTFESMFGFWGSNLSAAAAGGGGGSGGGVGNCMFAAHRASVELLTDVSIDYRLTLKLTAG
jgi:hypothetical protein